MVDWLWRGWQRWSGCRGWSVHFQRLFYCSFTVALTLLWWLHLSRLPLVVNFTALWSCLLYWQCYLNVMLLIDDYISSFLPFYTSKLYYPHHSTLHFIISILFITTYIIIQKKSTLPWPIDFLLLLFKIALKNLLQRTQSIKGIAS